MTAHRNKYNSLGEFKYTTAIKKLRRMKSRVRIVQGGTSAGKTYGILPLLIDQAARIPMLEISVVSESIPHLRKGALKDFLKIMRTTGRYIDDHYNRTLLTYTFSNGSYMEFFSADQEDKVRGPRRNVLYINECNNVSFETYHQLAIRTDMEVWLDFNPASEFWVHTEVAKDSDAELLVLTYKDNEALGYAIVREIEKAVAKAYHDPFLEPPELFDPDNVKNFYWHNWWKVYGLGLLGSLEGTVFTNWTQIDGIPPGAQLLGYAIDFGFTHDPATLVAAYRYDRQTIWDEMVYRNGLTNQDLANEMKALGVGKRDFVVADSAEPKSIEEINRYGFSVHPADKGKDSVNFGIDVMQQEDFLVTKRSVNMIRELRQYMWAKDKMGKLINKPVDANNHCIDPMRYLAMAKLALRTTSRGLRRKN